MSMLSTAFALKEMTGKGSFMMSSPQEQQDSQHQPPSMPVNLFVQRPPLRAGAANKIHGQHESPILMQPGFPVDQSEDVSQVPPAEVNDFNRKSVEPPMPVTPTAELPELREQLDQSSGRPSAVTSNSQEHQSEVKSSFSRMEDNHAKSGLEPSTKPQPEEVYEPADSALSFLVVTLFYTLFSMIWFFVKIPFRIGSVLFSFWVMAVALRVLWLFLADDNAAWEIGAGVDFEYNMPGIY